jgi:hypothetical protein
MLWGMAACPPALQQMALDITCYHTDQKSSIGLKATIHNSTAAPASIMASYVLGGKEHIAPGLVLQWRQSGGPDVEEFSYWPEGDRSGGGTGSIVHRVVVVAPGALHEWSIAASQLLSARTGRPFQGDVGRGELRAVFNVRETVPGPFPRLWNGRIESRRVQLPEDCKNGG